MRTYYFLAALSLVGCKWTDFDDLADTTWVRSTDEPNIGSRNYAIAILGVSAAPTGGQLGVISDDTPDFSLLEYDGSGKDTVGGNDVKLGQHRIAALSDPPLFATDGTGKIAIAERSTTGGAISVVFGVATAPAGVEFMANPATPEAVTFVGADIVVASGNMMYTLQGSTQVPCMNADASFSVAAMTTDATGAELFVWTKSGAFTRYSASAVTMCSGGTFPAPAAGSTFMTGLTPAPGARIHIVGNYAILTAHAPMSRMGQVFVVDLNAMQQTDTMLVEGLRSSTVATFGGTQTYLVIGVPDRAVEGVVSGQVDVHAFDTATGKLTVTPALVLHDAEPESGELFGRAVTTMKFNNNEVLVVAANSEVFAYFKTALYDALP